MVQNLNHLSPADPEDSSKKLNLSGDGGSLHVVFIILCVSIFFLSSAIIVIVLVHRHKARQERRVGVDNGHARVGVNNGHALQRAGTVMADVIDISNENSIDNVVPIASEIDLPIANATLTMPPASEDMDLPIAVVQPL